MQPTSDTTGAGLGLTDPECDLRRRKLISSTFLLPWFAACQPSPERKIDVGDRFPEIFLPNLAGQKHQLADAGGKCLLLNFWATWCAPCRKEMSSLDRLYLSLRHLGLVVCGISVDEDINLVLEYLLSNPISFPIFLDSNKQITSGFLGLKVFPTTLLVNQQRIVEEVIVGERIWDRAPLSEKISECLKR